VPGQRTARLAKYELLDHDHRHNYLQVLSDQFTEAKISQPEEQPDCVS
jgi:hypothetical protein